MSRSWTLPLGAAVVAVAGGVLALDPATAVAVGLAVLAGGLLVRRLDLSGEPWRNRPTGERRGGERRDAAELTWALAGPRGQVGTRAMRQVRLVAGRRLARHGLSLDDPSDEPAILALVGPRALATLRADGRASPRLSDVEHVVAVLDRIGPGRPADTPRRDA